MGIKFKVEESFFETWGQEMAYVLGFIFADGALIYSARGKYIVITSTDKDVIYKIKKWLRSEHPITKKVFPKSNRKPSFILKIGNKHIYDSLVRLGLYQNKSLTIRMPTIIPKSFLRDFVRGYFDGDGCVYLYRSKGIRQKMIVRKLSVIFTSGSKKFLEDLLVVLRREIQLQQTKAYTSNRSFQLRFATKDSIEIFKFLYEGVLDESYFRRKFRIFKEYFSLRPSKVDNRIRTILQ